MKLNKILQNKKINNILLGMVIGGTFFCAFYTFHDFQTAQGAGLYLSSLFHGAKRLPFDMATDFTGMVLLFLAISIPCLFLKKKEGASFLRMLSLYLAFIPSTSPGSLVHISEIFTNITLRESIKQHNFSETVFVDCAPLFQLLLTVLPFLLLLHYVNKDANLSSCFHAPYFPICILLLVLLNIFFTNFSQISIYFINYLFLILIFEKWEALNKLSNRFAMWSHILTFGCLLRGIYRMLVIINASHL